jgi:hypothetical protein
LKPCEQSQQYRLCISTNIDCLYMSNKKSRNTGRKGN